jgi:hypothetical protein
MLRVPVAVSLRAMRSSMTSPPVLVTICWPDSPSISSRGELGVRRLVLGEPDDAGVVLGGSAVVAERELLDAQHGWAQVRGEPVQRRRAEPAEADDDRPVVDHRWLLVVGMRGDAASVGARFVHVHRRFQREILYGSYTIEPGQQEHRSECAVLCRVSPGQDG